MPNDPSNEGGDLADWAGAGGAADDAAGAAAEPAGDGTDRAEDVLKFVANEIEECHEKLTSLKAAGDYPAKAMKIADKLSPIVEAIRALADDYGDDHGEKTLEEHMAASGAEDEDDDEAAAGAE